jgi:hypothetical protein
MLFSNIYIVLVCFFILMILLIYSFHTMVILWFVDFFHFLSKMSFFDNFFHFFSFFAFSNSFIYKGFKLFKRGFLFILEANKLVISKWLQRTNALNIEEKLSKLYLTFFMVKNQHND